MNTNHLRILICCACIPFFSCTDHDDMLTVDDTTAENTNTRQESYAGNSGEDELASDPDTLPISCAIHRMIDLGPALNTSNITGSPNGFLVTWKPEWSQSNSMQTFDVDGERMGTASVLTQSSSTQSIIGSTSGYVIVTNDEEPLVIRLDPRGSQQCASRIHTLSTGVLINGPTREMYVTQFVSSDRTSSMIDFYDVADDCELIRAGTLSRTHAEGSTDLSIRLHAVRSNDEIAVAIEQKRGDVDDSGTRRWTNTLSSILYDIKRNTFSENLLDESTDINRFVFGIGLRSSGFSIIWGMNNASPSPSKRYITDIENDGALSIAYDITPENGLGRWSIESDQLIHVNHDELTTERTFSIFTIHGAEKLAELFLSKGRDYYLGTPDFASAGNGAYAVKWVDQNADGSTSLKIGFVHCTLNNPSL